MYSKEEKERILADFRASGLSAKAYSENPSTPGYQTLRDWIKQAERGRLDVPLRSVFGRHDHDKHKRYPDDTKREALRLLDAGMRPYQIAKRLGISNGKLVSQWHRTAKAAKIAPKEGVSVSKKKDRRFKEPLPLKEAQAMSREELEEAYAEAQLRERVLLEVMFDPKVPCLEKLSNRRKTELGQSLRQELGISLCRVLTCLKISRSTYYDNLKKIREQPSSDMRKDRVAALVRSSFEASSRRYGYRRVYADLKSSCPEAGVSEREVRNAMRSGNMHPRRAKTKKYSSYKGESDSRPANLPLRKDGTHDFGCDAPGKLVVTDVTEFKTGGTKVYLSPIIDCFDGMPIAYASSLHPDSELCDTSLLRALKKASIRTIHSDGGNCYRTGTWKSICEKAGVVRSMSRKGCCGDNARAEGFFGILKKEFYHGHDWSKTPPDQFMRELDEYIRWYKEDRLKAFVENGRQIYDTLAGRRTRLGLST